MITIKILGQTHYEHFLILTIFILFSGPQGCLEELRPFTIKNMDNLQENPQTISLSCRITSGIACRPVRGHLVITHKWSGPF